MDAPVPAAVLERLGPESTAWIFNSQRLADRQLKSEVLEIMTDRFERRLSEEMAKVRAEMIAMEARITGTLLKGMFAFWVGQVVTMTAIVSFMLRAVR